MTFACIFSCAQINANAAELSEIPKINLNDISSVEKTELVNQIKAENDELTSEEIQKYFELGVSRAEGQEGLGFVLKIKDCALERVRIPKTLNDSVILYVDISENKTIKELDLPETVAYFDENCIEGCTSLEKINIDKNNKYLESRDNVVINKCVDNTLIVKYNCVLGNEDTGVSYTNRGNTLYAYLPNKSETEYMVPEGIKAINYKAFTNCNKLNKLTIPKSTTVLNNLSINNCANLTDIIIQSTGIEFSVDSIVSCNALVKIIYVNSSANINYGMTRDCSNVQYYMNNDNCIIVNGFVYNGSKTILYKCLNKEIETVEIPNTVTDIEANAFENCKKLKNITFNNGLVRIGYRAFSNCESIEKLNFPDTLTTIDTGAFLGCTSLKEIDSSSKLDVVGDYAFLNCNNLSYIYTKNSIKNVSDYALIGCNELPRIQLTTEAADYMYNNELDIIPKKLKLIMNNSGSSIKASYDGNSVFVADMNPDNGIEKK